MQRLPREKPHTHIAANETRDGNLTERERETGKLQPLTYYTSFLLLQKGERLERERGTRQGDCKRAAENKSKKVTALIQKLYNQLPLLAEKVVKNIIIALSDLMPALIISTQEKLQREGGKINAMHQQPYKPQ